MIKHGANRRGQRSPEYNSWAKMIQRCSNSNDSRYASYGGRGIIVCERWRTFENFFADMGSRPVGTSLDRFPDKHGNYEPLNCRWATPQQQQNNMRSNVLITWKGQTKSVYEWARTLGIAPHTLETRIIRGWAIDRAFSEKIHVKHCFECNHAYHRGACEHERGDQEVDGCLVAMGPCGCKGERAL